MKKYSTIVVMLLLMVSCKTQESKFNIVELNYSDNLTVVKRADWNWIPLDTAKTESQISKITIHHGGVIFNVDQDPIKSLQNLQKWSRAEKGWMDIPYHFMIDLEGKIYEARPINYPGDTNTEYDPTGHALIEVMGNYEVQEFSESQLNSMVLLSAYLAKEFNVSLEDIKTHKDYSEQTVCPGKNIYKYFENGSIIELIRDKLED